MATIAGRTAVFSGDNGPALDAHLLGAGETAVGPDGSIYVIDRMNRRIRAFTPGGIITTVAGTGAYGDSGDNGPATEATFKSLISLTVDWSGNLFIADSEAKRIRKVSVDGTITHFAGTGIGRYSGDNGLAEEAGFAYIQSIAAGPDGSLFVLDGIERCVRRIDAHGKITRYAGKRNVGSSVVAGDPLDLAGPALEAKFQNPLSIAVDSVGNLFVADAIDYVVRRITPQGIISRFAGTGRSSGPGGDGGPATAAFLKPTWIAADSDGTIYVQDTNSPPRIRRILPNGQIEAFAAVHTSRAVAVGGSLFGVQNDTVLRISSGGKLERIAGVSVKGYAADNQLALGATLGLSANSSLLIRDDGAILFTDSDNLRIRAILPNGTITTLVGGGSIALTDGVPATSAKFLSLGGIGIDALGAIYFTDPLLNAIYKVGPDGLVKKIGGNGGYGVPGRYEEGKPATEVPFMLPRSIAVTPNGDVYVLQSGGLWGIHKIQASDGSLHIVPLPDQPQGPISADLDGNVFVAPLDRGTILRIGVDGIVSKMATALLFESGLRYGLSISPQNLIAASSYTLQLSSSPDAVMTLGKSSAFMDGSAEDGSLGNSRFGAVGAVAFDKEGNLFFIDFYGQRIRRISAGCRITPQPVVTVVTGAAFSGTSDLAPGMLATVFGINLGPLNGQATKLDERGKVVTELAATRVLVDGVAAPVMYSSATQVNFVMPFSMEGRPRPYLQIEYNGVLSEPKSIPGKDASPELFGFGKDAYGNLTFLNSDWTINSSSNAARKGSSVIALGSGFGQTIPAGIDGLPNQSPLPRPLLPVEVKIDDVAVPIEYLGAAPGFVAGLMQMNIRVPENLTRPGLYRVQITVGESDTTDPARAEGNVYVQ